MPWLAGDRLYGKMLLVELLLHQWNDCEAMGLRKWLMCIRALLCALLLLPCAALVELEAHFIDVGHGDCTILLCDGEAMIVDGGPVSSNDLIFTYIRQLGITELKYAVATHPNTDHVGGLPAAFHAAKVRALYTPVLEYDGNRFQVLMEKAVEMEVPVIVPAAGQELTLGGAQITVLSPMQAYADVNDMSIVLRVTYGNHAFLLCGDAGKAVEKDLLDAGAELAADVIRISHHGSDTASSRPFLEAVGAQYAVISCSERYENPDPVIMERLLTLRAIPLCTDYSGDVVIRSDGVTLTLNTERYYVGNINSDVYHRMSCSSVEKMKEKNKEVVYSGAEAEFKGYRPCKNCSP